MENRVYKPKILVYDIETKPLAAWIWGLGEQSVRHGQLLKQHSYPDVICLAWEWINGPEDEPGSGVVGWGYQEQNSRPIIEKMDELIEKADVILGKNNKRFDDKYLNYLRLMHGLPAKPFQSKISEDLEVHMRRLFRLPSHSLDYVSNLLGLGGKNPVNFDTWIDIVEKRSEESYHTMLKYNQKDVSDTVAVWQYMESHFTPSFKAPKHVSSTSTGELACRTCGSTNVSKHGVRVIGGRSYQRLECKEHGGYGGLVLITNAVRNKA